MPDTSTFITIDHVVNSYLNWKNIADLGDYDRFKQILIEGFTDLNIFHTTYFRTHKATVNEVNQIRLPSDYIDWLVVYVEVDGEKFELDHNDNLIIPVPDNCGEVVVFDEHLMAPTKKGYKYTTRRRNVFGGFKIDSVRKVCQFTGNIKGINIYIEYSATGIPETGVVFVPRELLTVLRSFLDWQLKEADDMIPPIKTQRAENTYGRLLMAYYEHKDQLSGKEYLNLFRDSMTQGIKR